jgi:hypothetical protein
MISRCLRPAPSASYCPLSPDSKISLSQPCPPGFPFVGDYANDHILLWALAPMTTHDARGEAAR